jgi:hypothetical protein
LIIKTLDYGYVIEQIDSRHFGGWISYWIMSSKGRWVKSFTSAGKAEQWFEMNRDKLNKSKPMSDAEKQARSLTRRMGIKWETLSEEEKQEWIDEVS